MFFFPRLVEACFEYLIYMFTYRLVHILHTHQDSQISLTNWQSSLWVSLTASVMIPRELLKPYPCGLLTGYFGRCILYITNDNMAGEGHNHLTAFLLETRPFAHPCNVVLEFVCQIDTGETLQMEPSPSCTFPCLCILYHTVWPCRGARENFRGQRAVCLCTYILIPHFTWLKAQLQCNKQSNTDFFDLSFCHLQLMPWKSAFANSIPPSCFKVQLFLTALVQGGRLFTNFSGT